VERDGEGLTVRARGVSAHSMDPWEGTNAITHLAGLLVRLDWPDTAAARMVRWINDLVGTGDFAERFGDLAYEHDFMGRLTLTLATVTADDGRLTANVSFRRPVGRSAEEVEGAIRAAVDGWKERTGTGELELETKIYDPYLLEDAPHVATLLEVFRQYSGLEDAGPVAIGGGTNARLLPNGVSFGPSMPGETYTGHSEHEFITREQFLLNLKMYTAALAELSLR
jgi:dipeptidase D